MHSIRFTIGLILLNLTIVACSNPDKSNCEKIIDEYEECLENSLNDSIKLIKIGVNSCDNNFQLSVEAIENNSYKEKLKRFQRNTTSFFITQCFNTVEVKQGTTVTASILQNAFNCGIDSLKQKRKGVCSE